MYTRGVSYSNLTNDIEFWMVRPIFSRNEIAMTMLEKRRELLWLLSRSAK